MPTRPLAPCATPLCSGKATIRGRCPGCAGRYDRSRGTAHQRGYTTRWSRAAAAFRRKFPLCGMRVDGQQHGEHSRCTREGIVTAGQAVDHIRPHKGSDTLFWDRSNWQTLCQTCHAVKTATEDGGFGR